jgi:hypothetical protein
MYAYLVVSMLWYFFMIGWPFAVLVLAMWLVLLACIVPRNGNTSRSVERGTLIHKHEIMHRAI